jgi:hypothetical protein
MVPVQKARSLTADMNKTLEMAAQRDKQIAQRKAGKRNARLQAAVSEQKRGNRASESGVVNLDDIAPPLQFSKPEWSALPQRDVKPEDARNRGEFETSDGQGVQQLSTPPPHPRKNERVLCCHGCRRQLKSAPQLAARTLKGPTGSAVLLVTLAECTQQGARKDWHADVQFGPRCRQRTATIDAARSNDHPQKGVTFQVPPEGVVDTVKFEFVNNDDGGRGSQVGAAIGRAALLLNCADMQQKWKLDQWMDIVDATDRTVGSCRLVVRWAPPGMGGALLSRMEKK